MPSQYELSGYAIVTGAASGIGKEIGFTFAEAGVKGIIFADINGDGASKAAEESKSLATHAEYRAIGIQVDVASAESVKNMVVLAEKEFGTIQYLVNAAGIDVAEYTPYTSTSEADWDRVLSVNAKGIFLVTREVAKVMQRQDTQTLTTKRHGTRSIGRGAIVNIASALAYAAVPAKVPYIASKHAALGLTRSASAELNPFGIRVNAVCPTWVDTPMFEEETRRVPMTPEILRKNFAPGRPIGTDEVAAAVQYLCSPSAVYVSGHGLMIDGGITAAPVLG